MPITRPGRAAIAAAATALLLSACSVQTTADPEFLAQSPRAITKTAFAEMADLSSVRILGTVVSPGDRTKIDVRVDDEGNCTGSLELKDGNAQFIHNADATWLKADERFWQQNAQSPQQARQILAALGTSWTEAPARSTDVEKFCDAATFLDEFKARKDGGEGRLSKGATELIGETEAIAISAKGGGQSSTVWVAVTSPHRVVKILSRDRGNPTTISFEEFGVEVNAEAPAEDDVVDLSAYAKK